MSIGGDTTGDTPPPLDRGGSRSLPRPDQLERADGLRHLGANGPTIADLYLEAASRVDGCTTEAKMAVLAHCVREILNRLPGVLGHVFDDYRERQANAIKRLSAAVETRAHQDAASGDRDEADVAQVSGEVDAAVAEVVETYRLGSGENQKKSRALVLGRAEGESPPEPSEAAVDAVTTVRRFFTNQAHIGEEPRSLPTLEDIRGHFVLVERTLDHGLQQFWRGHEAMREVLARANASTLDVDGMPVWGQPSEADILALALALVSPINASVFFGQLLNPVWFEPLRQRNIIGAPRAPIPVEGGGVTFPTWPEGSYLARMASEMPEEVMRYFLDVDLVGNGLAERDLVEAAIALPVENAVRLRNRVVASLRGPIGWLNPERLVVLVERLATATSTQALNLLVTALFGSPSSLDDYWFKELLPRAACSLQIARGPAAVSMLTGFLHDHLTTEDRGQSRGWRSEVAHSGEQFIFEVGNALVDAIMDVSRATLAENPASLRDIVDALVVPSIQTGASARVAMLVVSEAIRSGMSGAVNIGQELLLNESYLAWEYEPEYSTIGRLILEGTVTEVADSWFEIVGRDPEFAGNPEEDVREIAARFCNVDVADVSAEHIETLQRFRMRGHLALMEGSLPDELAARLATLDAEFGSRPARESWGPTFTSFVGPTSPVSSEEIEAMSGDELVDYLKAWKAPESNYFGPTPEGLGRQLAVFAERHPERLLNLADQLVELSPTYLRHILQGWKEAIRQEVVELDWEKVVKVILFIAEKPDEGDIRDNFDEDVGWRAAQQEAASLLEAALRLRSELAPRVGLRADVWAAIERLSLSPDPSPVREATSGMDAGSMSINSVRPYVVSAAVMYLWWLVQAEVVARGGDPADTAPEVWHLLDRHLDPQIDPSVAVRATLGSLYPFLASVSPAWARAKVEQFFVPGGGDENVVRADAAWASYVRRSVPNERMFEFLAGIYLERLRPTRAARLTTDSRESAEARTAEHVLLLYANGLIGLDSDDGLIAALFNNYTPLMRAQVLGHFGRLLFQQVEALSEEQVVRLRALWEWRRQMVDSGEDPTELAGFGWWFRSGKFPVQWAASQLAHAATRGVTFDGSAPIIEVLAAHASEIAGDAVTVLEAFIRDREPWETQWVGKDSAPILAAGLDSFDPEVRARADRLLQTLGAQGLLSLRDEVAALRATGDAPPNAATPDGDA